MTAFLKGFLFLPVGEFTVKESPEKILNLIVARSRIPNHLSLVWVYSISTTKEIIHIYFNTIYTISHVPEMDKGTVGILCRFPIIH